jgi:hypothetical protein
MIGGKIQEDSNKQAQQCIQSNHAIPHGLKLMRIVPHGFDKDKARLYNLSDRERARELVPARPRQLVIRCDNTCLGMTG